MSIPMSIIPKSPVECQKVNVNATPGLNTIVRVCYRGLANLPMESMESGGLGWFTDLTIPDPYYGLPLLLCSSTFLQVLLVC